MEGKKIVCVALSETATSYPRIIGKRRRHPILSPYALNSKMQLQVWVKPPSLSRATDTLPNPFNGEEYSSNTLVVWVTKSYRYRRGCRLYCSRGVQCRGVVVLPERPTDRPTNLPSHDGAYWSAIFHILMWNFHIRNVT